jgi:hypothetical protein
MHVELIYTSRAVLTKLQRDSEPIRRQLLPVLPGLLLLIS